MFIDRCDFVEGSFQKVQDTKESSITTEPRVNTASETINASKDQLNPNLKAPSKESKMSSRSNRSGFLPIAKPRGQDVSSSEIQNTKRPTLIEVRNSYDHGDDGVTELSDMTYIAEFKSVERHTVASKRRASSTPSSPKSQKYLELLEENRKSRGYSGHLQSVTEERDAIASTASSRSKAKPIDVSCLESQHVPTPEPIDVTGIEYAGSEAIDLTEPKTQSQILLDAAAMNKKVQTFKENRRIKLAKRDRALLEAKARKLLSNASDITGNSHSRDKNPEEKTSEPAEKIEQESQTQIQDENGSRELGSDGKSKKETREASANEISHKSTERSQTRSPPSPESQVTPSSTRSGRSSSGSLLGLSARIERRLSARNARAGSTRSNNSRKTTNIKSNPVLRVKEKVSAEGGVIIDTTEINERDLQLLQKETRGDEPHNPATSSSSSSRDLLSNTEIAKKELDLKDHFNEFVLFYAGMIKTLASKANGTVNETLPRVQEAWNEASTKVQEELQLMPSLVTDEDMDGMLSALDKGMSEKHFIVPKEDDRELLSNFLDENLSQPICGDPAAGFAQSDPVINASNAAGKKNFKFRFPGCGTSSPQIEQSKYDDMPPREFVVPMNEDSSFGSSTIDDDL